MDMIKRELYLNRIRPFLNTPVVKVLTGMRRSGKSVVLSLIADELRELGVDEERIISLNFESLEHERLTDYHELYRHIIAKAATIKDKVYLLFDEIQEVSSWEKAINSFRVDLDCDIVITGSNDKLFSSELASLLTGRFVEIRVFPLSFDEYLLFRGRNAEAETPNRRELFDEYLLYGSLPGIHELPPILSVRETYTNDILNSILLKDVIRRNSIRDTELLDRVLLFIMSNIGGIFSAKRVADFLKSQRRSLGVETIYNYLRALQSAFLIYKVSRFDVKGKRFLETQEKYFIGDHGMAQARLGHRSSDITGQLENLVFMELLRRGYSVSVGKQDVREIDFVATRKEEKLYLQVCYLLSEDAVIDREFRPLVDIHDNYPKVVLSLDETWDSTYEGIRRFNLRDYLLSPDW
jgi:predicted AAA+ superfamily ATPase